MQIQIFTLPLMPDVQQMEELNHFLRANKIIDIRKELAVLDGRNLWTFCVTYIQEMGSQMSMSGKNGKIDYKEVLDESAFQTFSTLRKARKEIAEADAVPAYAVFTDAELAEMSKMEELTASNIQRIQGIGKKRAEKYAEALLSRLNGREDETSGVSD